MEHFNRINYSWKIKLNENEKIGTENTFYEKISIKEIPASFHFVQKMIL